MDNRLTAELLNQMVEGCRILEQAWQAKITPHLMDASGRYALMRILDDSAGEVDVLTEPMTLEQVNTWLAGAILAAHMTCDRELVGVRSEGVVIYTTPETWRR